MLDAFHYQSGSKKGNVFTLCYEYLFSVCLVLYGVDVLPLHVHLSLAQIECSEYIETLHILFDNELCWELLPRPLHLHVLLKHAGTELISSDQLISNTCRQSTQPYKSPPDPAIRAETFFAICVVIPAVFA